MRPIAPWVCLLLASGCGAGVSSTAGQADCPTSVAPEDGAAQPLATVPLGRGSDHFHTVPIRLDGRVVTTAILDTGIGLALVSQALCERLECTIDGEFTGRRMSGQAITLPTTHIARIELGDYAQENVVAAVVDIEGFFPEPQVEAFLGLPFFETTPFTIDVARGAVIVESEASLAAREADASALPIRLDRQGVAIDAFVQMRLEGGATAEMMMDTGSRGVTLHTRYAEAMGIDLEGDAVRVREGQDETGHTYRRYFTTLDAPLTFDAAPELSRSGLGAMFQEIIHDGLFGTELMNAYVLTFDLPRQRVLLTPGAAS